jgi:hypothetical protein
MNSVFSFKVWFSIFVVNLVFLFLVPAPVSAVFFDQAFVRLDRQQAGAALSGLVCAQPSSSAAGIEAKINLTFPADFSLNQNPADWTVSDSELPSGAVFWPSSDSSPVQINGQTVTVFGSDLTADQLYCFHLSSPASRLGQIGKSTGRIVTRTSADLDIDDREFGIQILSGDQITLSGHIPAKPPDLNNSLVQLTTGSTHIQDVTLEYQLTYGSLLHYSTDLVVQVSWSLGTIQGELIPTIDLLEYADRSAEPAYSDIPAVINLTDRTITWTIPDFPANTIDQVKFKFRTKSDHRGSAPVAFSITSQVSDPETNSLPSTVTNSYLYDPHQSTQTSSSSSSPYSSSTSVSSPAALPADLDIPDLSVRSVLSDQAVLAVRLNQPAKITVNYGRRSDLLNQTVTSLQYSAGHQIRLDNLDSDTPYFFRLAAVTQSGKILTTSLYTFRTSSSSQHLSFDPKSFFALSSGKLIFDPTFLLGLDSLPFLIVPKNFDYEIKFSLADQIPIESARVRVENKRVLGWASVVKAEGPGIENGEVLEVASNAFTSKLTTPDQTGEYEIYVQTIDIYGNQTTTKLADLYVTDYLTVTDSVSGDPVEDAQINFYLYDPNNKIYKFISPQVFSIRNPDYTDKDGRLRVALPPLHYRVDVNAIGYQPQSLDFSLQPGRSNFPALKLKPEPFVFKTVVVYYATIVADSLEVTHAYVNSLAVSTRFFQLSALITICFFVFLNYISLRARTNIPMLSLFEHFWRHTGAALSADASHERIFGMVIDKLTRRPLAKTGVFILDQRDKVVSHALTDAKGNFSLAKLFSGAYKLEVLKDGYASAVFSPVEPLILELTRTEVADSALSRLKSFFWGLASLLFEFLLIASLIFELSFGFFFSWWQVLPFLLLSLANLLLWLVYRIHLRA